MKKTTIIYLLLFLVVGGAAAWLLLKKDKATISEALHDFAVEDTSNVTRIEMTDKLNHHVVLSRKGPGAWTVNDSFDAKESNIDLLLEGISMVRMKEPVPLASRDRVIKELAVSGTKVVIYKGGNEPAKVYYVGGTTPDELGTYMLLQGSSEPFVTHIPGFNGYLTPRYFATQKDWRSTDLFRFNAAAIKEVSLEYPGAPDASFKLKAGRTEYEVEAMDGSGVRFPVPAVLARKYLVMFDRKTFEGFADFSKKQLDSFNRQKPFAILTIKAEGGKEKKMELYTKPVERRSRQVGGEEKTLDSDRYFAIMDGRRDEVLIVQEFQIGELLRNIRDFKEAKKEQPL